MTVAPIQKTVFVPLSQKDAFNFFSEKIDTWWPAAMSIAKSPQRDVILEPHAGGRWYEIAEDGSECEWGKVLEWAPPARIVLNWQINASFQYDPALRTEVELQFKPASNGTEVFFEHRLLQNMGTDAARIASELGSGWPKILDRFASLAAGRESDF